MKRIFCFSKNQKKISSLDERIAMIAMKRILKSITWHFWHRNVPEIL